MTLAILVARMGSSRLPGKSMKPLLGKPMVERMIERLGKAESIERLALATTHSAQDDPLADLAKQLGIGCYRGSTEDVLGRIHGAEQTFGADTVVELLGDNPLIHSALIDDVVEFYRAGKFDYAASVTTEYPFAPAGLARFPLGIRVQVYSAEVLKRCAAQATDPRHREHSTSYMIEHPEQFRLGYFEAAGPWAPLHRPELFLAVNEAEQMALIRRIFETCYPKNSNFTLQEALQALDACEVAR